MRKNILKATFLATSLLALSGVSFAKNYEITVTNNMSEELMAPVLVTSVDNDSQIFVGQYVTNAAESQILTGNPEKLVKKIGKGMVTVAHGSDGPPGVLLSPGKSITFTVNTDMPAVRILTMVAPTMVPDNYLSGIINLSSPMAITLDRYDIGHNEDRKTISHVAGGAAVVTIK